MLNIEIGLSPYEGMVRQDLLKMAKQNSNLNEFMTYDGWMKERFIKDMQATAQYAEKECEMSVASHLRDEMRRFGAKPY